MAGAGSVAVWARSDDAGRNSGSKPVYVARGGIARRHRQMSVFALRLKAARSHARRDRVRGDADFLITHTSMDRAVVVIVRSLV